MNCIEQPGSIALLHVSLGQVYKCKMVYIVTLEVEGTLLTKRHIISATECCYGSNHSIILLSKFQWRTYHPSVSHQLSLSHI